MKKTIRVHRFSLPLALQSSKNQLCEYIYGSKTYFGKHTLDFKCVSLFFLRRRLKKIWGHPLFQAILPVFSFFKFSIFSVFQILVYNKGFNYNMHLKGVIETLNFWPHFETHKAIDRILSTKSYYFFVFQ